MKRVFNTLLFLCLLSACKHKDETSIPEVFPADLSRGVLILCEGNFNRGSGDVWFYDTTSHKAYPGLFKQQNGYDLGNVVQSYFTSGDYGFIVVNNSGKISVVDRRTFKQKASIIGFQSPRYIVPSANAGIAYVTDLYSGQLSLLNTASFSKLPQTIPLGAWTEQGLRVGDKAHIISRRIMLDARPGGEQVYTLDAQTNQVLDSVMLGTGGEEMVYDEQRNTLWLSFEHAPEGSGKARLVRYNLADKTQTTIELDGLKPSRLSLTPDGEYLFFLHNGLSYISLSNPTQVINPAPNSRNWSSLKVISGSSGGYRILACDARDYNSNGRGYDYVFSNGVFTPTDSFTVGIIPGNIYLGGE